MFLRLKRGSYLLNLKSEIKHFFHDVTTGNVVSMDKDKLDSELDKIAKTLEYHINKLENIANFILSTVTFTLGVKGDIIVIGVDGGITLTYTRN